MGLEVIINVGVKQHISIGEFSTGDEYIMRGWVCKSMRLFNLLDFRSVYINIEGFTIDDVNDLIYTLSID